MKRFKDVVKSELNSPGSHRARHREAGSSPTDETDDRGKPLVPASTKLQASQMLIEHIVGKPTQRVEQDISVKLSQASSELSWRTRTRRSRRPHREARMTTRRRMHRPTSPAHFPGHTIPVGPKDDEAIDVDFFEDS
jgi:hypothetical protein